MPKFYSPEGNLEVWEKKPKGYLSVEEWQVEHPASEPVPITIEELALQVRMERTSKLAATDYFLVSDYPIDDRSLSAIKEYRQALRDIPAQVGFPKNVEWPEMPDVKVV